MTREPLSVMWDREGCEGQKETLGKAAKFSDAAIAKRWGKLTPLQKEKLMNLYYNERDLSYTSVDELDRMNLEGVPEWGNDL